MFMRMPVNSDTGLGGNLTQNEEEYIILRLVVRLDKNSEEMRGLTYNQLIFIFS